MKLFLFARRVKFGVKCDFRNKHWLFPCTALPGFVSRRGQEIFFFCSPKRPDRLWDKSTLLFDVYFRGDKVAGAWQPLISVRHRGWERVERTSTSRLFGLDQIVIISVAQCQGFVATCICQSILHQRIAICTQGCGKFVSLWFFWGKLYFWIWYLEYLLRANATSGRIMIWYCYNALFCLLLKLRNIK